MALHLRVRPSSATLAELKCLLIIVNLLNINVLINKAVVGSKYFNVLASLGDEIFGSQNFN
jgi:hypothetical protein